MARACYLPKGGGCRMELLQLRYFIALAECENMTKVAADFHVAQPAVSQSISRLEKELEVKLFDRTAGRLHLNQFGESFLKKARLVLDTLDDAARELRDAANAPKRLVRICLESGHRTLPKIIAAFRAQSPDVDFRLFNPPAPGEKPGDRHVYDMLVHSALDGAPHLPGDEVLREELFVVAPKTSPLAAKPFVELEELAGEPYISLAYSGSDDAPAPNPDFFCRIIGFTPHIMFQSGSFDNLKYTILSEMGITIWPEYSLPQIMTPGLAALRIGEGGCHRCVYIVKREDGALSDAARRFYDFSIHYYKQYSAPPW